MLERARTLLLRTNTIAPDFTLPDQMDHPVSLSDFRGKRVVLAFYPKDNSLVCSRQLGNYQTHYTAFKEQNVEILGISADTTASHRNFSDQCGLEFPLLTDTDKSVCKTYGAVNAFGAVRRVVYIIDADGVIRHVLNKFSLFYVPADELLKLL